MDSENRARGRGRERNTREPGYQGERMPQQGRNYDQRGQGDDYERQSYRQQRPAQDQYRQQERQYQPRQQQHESGHQQYQSRHEPSQQYQPRQQNQPRQQHYEPSQQPRQQQQAWGPRPQRAPEEGGRDYSREGGKGYSGEGGRGYSEGARGGYSERARGGYSGEGARGGYSGEGARGGYSGEGARGGYSAEGARGPSGQGSRGQPQEVPPQRPSPPSVSSSHQEHAGNAGASGDNLKAVTSKLDQMALNPRKPRRGALSTLEPERVTIREGLDKRGATGRPVKVLTNMFKFDVGSGSYQQYHLSFVPEVGSTRFKRHLLKTVAETIGITGKHVTDGSMLYCPFVLDESLLQNLQVTVSETETYKVVLKHVGSVCSTSPAIVQMLNVLFRNIGLKGIGMTLIGDSFFRMSEGHMFQKANLKIVPGYSTSIMQYEGGLRLMVDVSHKVISSFTALDYANDIMDRTDIPKDDKMKRIRNYLVGRVVMTPYNNKTYKIDDIDLSKTPLSKFSLKAGEEIDYRTYYKQRYNVDIRNPNQPLLVSKAKRRDIRAGAPDHIYLIPELCQVTGISEDVKSNFNMMKDLAAVTKVNPEKRAQEMKRLMIELSQNKEVMQKFKNFNIEMSPQMASINARQLPDVVIQTGKPGRMDWMSVTRSALFKSVQLKRWAIVYNSKFHSNIGQFLTMFKRVAGPMGLQVSDPQMYDYSREHEMSDILRECSNGMEFVCVILVNNNTTSYNAVKKYLCQKSPVLTQCVTERNVRKHNISIVSKVVLQVNCKLGGAGWTLDRMGLEDTMIIGIDTYHDSEQRTKSVVGIVASLDKHCTKYFTTWGWQQRYQEIGTCLHQAMIGCLNAYKRANRKEVKQIIVYRDGVGDGQLDMVIDTEISQIKSALAEQGVADAKLAVIVVKKRISNRFFTGEAGRLDNPKPGLVVDTEATRPMWYDFYLVNQEVREGSATPTHFNVIYDSTGIPPDMMQCLTYKQCHGYYNWAGPIRVPAPCQYAHKVAFLIGQSLHKNPDESLSDKLFYL